MTSQTSLPKVLVVDDDTSFRCLLTEELSHTFPTVVGADSAAVAFELCKSTDFDVILLDIRMPGRDGMEVLTEIKSGRCDGEIIMMTGHASVDTAIRSLKLGAYDYLTKPCKLEELESIVQKAHEKRVLRKQNWTLRQMLDRQVEHREFLGQSEAAKQLREILSKVSPTDCTLLIRGESGTGKGVIARAIHEQSSRRSLPFVIVDCTSLQEDLLQSELFGHESGSFTGAQELKHGLFEVADGGTLFLDEIGDLPLGLQSKLLRVLETGTFRRLGGVRNLHVDVRIVAATNHNLEEMVEHGYFRNDLYYRINVVSITAPTLRERMADIELLVGHFMDRAMHFKKHKKSINPAALAILHHHSWPGNVRELANVIERALLLSEAEEIQVEDLPPNLRPNTNAPLSQLEHSLPKLKDLEELYIQNLLKRFSGHRGRIAAALGISERSLYRKLRGYGLDGGQA